MKKTDGQKFWNKFANRYAARRIKDEAAYEALVSDASARLKKSDKVLEIGCGTGGTAIRLAPYVAQYIATDFSAEMIRISQSKPAPENLRFAVADAEQSIDEGPFDAICAFNVLHLTDDLPTVLASIHSRLQPGGLLISKTWCFADMGIKLRILFRILKAFRLFPPSTSISNEQLRHTFQAAGFKIEVENFFGAYRQNPYIVARKP